LRRINGLSFGLTQNITDFALFSSSFFSCETLVVNFALNFSSCAQLVTTSVTLLSFGQYVVRFIASFSLTRIISINQMLIHISVIFFALMIFAKVLAGFYCNFRLVFLFFFEGYHFKKLNLLLVQLFFQFSRYILLFHDLISLFLL